jgi:thiamine monophosphate synthase
MKIKQGCSEIIFSKLFEVDYDSQAAVLGVVKFNYLINMHSNIIPLGGIKINNLNKLRMIRSSGFAIMSEIKKKPAISNRLF